MCEERAVAPTALGGVAKMEREGLRWWLDVGDDCTLVDFCPWCGGSLREEVAE